MQGTENPAPTPAPPLACIPAYSHRQVMDWSLVLASQGIEAVIEHSPETGAWRLLVEPQDQARALAAIRLYRAENRGWAWRQRLTWPGLVFHWGALVWCWLLILFQWLMDALGERAADLGVMNSTRFAQGEWWRAFTAISLHADLSHLAANASTGLIVYGLTMARFGAGWAMLAGLLAGALGNVAGFLVHTKPYEGLGASGMVMGGLGMLAVQSVFLLRESPKAWKQFVSGMLGGCMLFVLVGLNPSSDVVAHAGGFVAGLVLGLGLALLPARWARETRADQCAGAAALVWFATTWALALLLGHTPAEMHGPIP